MFVVDSWFYLFMYSNDDYGYHMNNATIWMLNSTFFSAAVKKGKAINN